MVAPTQSVRDALGPAAESAGDLDISMDGAATSTVAAASAADILRLSLGDSNSAAKDLEDTLGRIQAKFGGVVQ